MNICLLCRHYFPSSGGIETSVYQLSRAFAHLGHTVIIVTASKRPLKSRKEYAQIVYVPADDNVLSLLPSTGLRLLERKCMQTLEQIKRSCQPDLMIGRDSLLTCAAIRTCQGIPMIYMPSMDVKEFVKIRKKTYGNLKQLLCSLLEVWVFQIEIRKQEYALYHSACSVVFCEGMRRQLLQSYPKTGTDIKVCYPGCTMNPVDPGSRRPGKKTRFLFVGRLAPEKNLRMLLEALAYIREEIRLTIVGDGSEIFVLKKMAAQLNTNIEVVFEGFREDVLQYYMDADFFVLPSKYESFGQVIIEAFSCGVPVIGFSTMTGVTNTAVEELVRDHVTGFICREFSPEKLADCMKEAIRMKKEKIDMGAACVKYARVHCSWENLADVCLKESEGSRV